MKTTIRYIMRAAALNCLLAAAATAYGGEIRYTLQLDPSAIETDTITAPLTCACGHRTATMWENRESP